jgi:hypothetical protein
VGSGRPSRVTRRRRARSVCGVACRASRSAMLQPMDPASRALVNCGSDCRRRARVRLSAAHLPPRQQRSSAYAPKVEKPSSWRPSPSRWRAWPIRRRRRPAPRATRWSWASSWAILRTGEAVAFELDLRMVALSNARGAMMLGAAPGLLWTRPRRGGLSMFGYRTAVLEVAGFVSNSNRSLRGMAAPPRGRCGLLVWARGLGVRGWFRGWRC